MPIEVIYCGVCGVPPEYCNFANKNSDPCKEWLNKGYPDLSDIIYPKEDDGQEEEKKQTKKKKGITFAEDSEKKIKILSQKRSGKKKVSTIIGLNKFGIDLKHCAKFLSKKFATSAAAIVDE